MTETFTARETTPFPEAPGEPSHAASDVLAGDWAEGLRAPVREHGLPTPRRRGVAQSAPAAAARAPEPEGAVSGEGASPPVTEQLDLRALEALASPLEIKETAPAADAAEVEAPEAWASAEEDQLASVPPPVRDAGKEEVLLLSDAELAEDDEPPAANAPAEATRAMAPSVDGSGAAHETATAAAEATPAPGQSAEQQQGLAPAGAPAAASGSAAASGASAAPASGADDATTSGAVPAAGASEDATASPASASSREPAANASGNAPATASATEDAAPAATALAPPASMGEGGATLAPEPLGEPLREEEIHLVLAAVAPGDEEHIAPAELLDSGEGLAWDVAPRADETHAAGAPAVGGKRASLEELAPEDAGDPWSAAFAAPVPAASAPAAAEWGSALGGDAIDWAPALAPTWDPPAEKSSAHAWEEAPHSSAMPLTEKPSTPAAPRQATPAAEAWNDHSSWDAETVHAVSLPSLLARSRSDQEWASAPATDWQVDAAPAGPNAPSLGNKDSLFAVLPPGASLSGEDEQGTPEHELAELGPGDLEPLPDEPDLLVPLDESSPGRRDRPLLVPGEHRVAVQTRAGTTRRGVLRDADLSAATLTLDPGGAAAKEQIPASEVKAIFFMLAPGERVPRGSGVMVTATLVDGRQIHGEREGPDAPEGFFVIPADASRTNTQRIYVARAALAALHDG